MLLMEWGVQQTHIAVRRPQIFGHIVPNSFSSLLFIYLFIFTSLENVLYSLIAYMKACAVYWNVKASSDIFKSTQQGDHSTPPKRE